MKNHYTVSITYATGAAKGTAGFQFAIRANTSAGAIRAALRRLEQRFLVAVPITQIKVQSVVG